MMYEENYTNENLEDEEPVIIPLELENGTSVNSHVIAVFNCEGIDYIALLPEGTEEILMFRYIETAEDEIQIINIEEEQEWEKVVKCFDDLLEAEEE